MQSSWFSSPGCKEYMIYVSFYTWDVTILSDSRSDIFFLMPGANACASVVNNRTILYCFVLNFVNFFQAIETARSLFIC